MNQTRLLYVRSGQLPLFLLRQSRSPNPNGVYWQLHAEAWVALAAAPVAPRVPARLALRALAPVAVAAVPLERGAVVLAALPDVTRLSALVVLRVAPASVRTQRAAPAWAQRAAPASVRTQRAAPALAFQPRASRLHAFRVRAWVATARAPVPMHVFLLREPEAQRALTVV
jgi:hypothetical protein